MKKNVNWHLVRGQTVEEYEPFPHTHPHRRRVSYSEECRIKEIREVNIALASGNYKLL